MNKKIVILGITLSFILVSGICYSCTYQKSKASGDSEVIPLQEEIISEEKSVQTAEVTGEPVSDETKTDKAKPDYTKQKEAALDEEATIYVHICGAVTHPGVYKVWAGARVCDLIVLSGGLTEDAAGDYINQAEKVSDGQRIYIPTSEEAKDLSAMDYISGDRPGEETKQASSGLLNINTATAEEFMELPGIGETKAESILRIRSEKGRFTSIEELKEVPGIKEGLFDQISSLITVE